MDLAFNNSVKELLLLEVVKQLQSEGARCSTTPPSPGNLVFSKGAHVRLRRYGTILKLIAYCLIILESSDVVLDISTSLHCTSGWTWVFTFTLQKIMI